MSHHSSSGAQESLGWAITILANWLAAVQLLASTSYQAATLLELAGEDYTNH